jgi:hypothetical protein
MQTNSSSRSIVDELRLTPQNPWPGLPAFTAANSQFFFGREAEIAEIFRRVRRQMLTVLFGVSGLGKTSLLQAGLLPRLGGTPFHPILIRLDHAPEAEDLIEQVRSAISRAAAAAADNPNLRIPRAPEKDEDLWGYFHDKALDWFNGKGEPVYPVLVFDQFEEIFTRETRTRATEERKQRFIESLACLVENRPPDALARDLEANPDLSRRYDFRQDDYRVVISLREDFLAHLEGLKRRIPSVMENRMRLTRMDREQALQAVIGPGREIVDESVAREIVAFVAGKAREGHAVSGASSEDESLAPSGVEPALLSLVCDELNRRRLERNQERITADLLTEEREGIIQAFYDRAFEGVDNRVREWVEDELLTTSGYRDRAAIEDALRLGLPASALNQLVDRRILHREEREGVVWLELTHDLLTGPAERSRTLREQRLQAEAATAREQQLTRERDRQRRRARRSRVVSVSLAIALFSVAAWGWLFWDSNLRGHARYFNTFSKVNGIPIGVGHLSANQVAHRAVSFRFLYQGRPEPLVRLPFLRPGTLLQVQAVNSRGVLTPKHNVGTYFKYASEDENPNRECQWKFLRDADGKVAYEMALDRQSNLVWGFVYSPAQTDQNTRRAHYVGPNGLPRALPNSGAQYVELTFDRLGNEITVRYLDDGGEPQPARDGAYGVAYEYATGILPSRIKSLDANGQPMNDTAGNSGMDFEYDRLGNVTRASAFDANTNRTPVRSGFYSATRDFDEQGNLVRMVYHGVDGQPVVTTNGYAIEEMRYDEWGYATNWACFDANGEPTTDEEGKHRLKLEYDERGNRTNLICLDLDGLPVLLQQGYAQIANKYDERDNRKEIILFDQTGKPVASEDGWTSKRMEFDERNRVIAQTYLDELGHPVQTKGGYAKETFKYDERGNQIERACFDTDGRPAIDLSLGHHLVRKTYGARGNLTALSYFDISGNPAAINSGYARVSLRYNAQGRETDRLYFDADGQPAFDLAMGYHWWRGAYDEQGNLVGVSYFDKGNQLIMTTSGYAQLSMRYDRRRNRIEQACFDTAGRLTRSKDGYAINKSSYDERDNRIETAYFDTVTNLVSGPDGYARETLRYDSHRRKVEASYFYEPGNSMRTNGYAIIRLRYNEQGRRTDWACFDENGKPALDASLGNHLSRRAYDKRGNIIEISYLDKAGHPMITRRGYARLSMKYDSRGKQIEESCLDTADKLTLSKDGYAMVKTAYDGTNRIETAYFDTATNLVSGPDGYAREALRYDSHGRKIEVSYFYEPENSMRTNGYAIIRLRYNEQGRRTEWACFNEDGHPALDLSVGNHRLNSSYDARGNLIESAYFDRTGQPTTNRQGYARVSMKYDSRGNRIEWTCYDLAGKLTLSTAGYAILRTRYDNRGTAFEETYFDANNRELKPQVFIAEVLAGGEGQAIGLRAYDVIVAYAGEEISSIAGFISQVTAPGEGLRELKIRRGAELRVFQVKPGKLNIRLDLRFEQPGGAGIGEARPSTPVQ